jgi:hypothetical protein
MTQINEKMDHAIINDDFDKIESIALNPNHAYVKVTDVNLFTGNSRTTHRWVDVSNVGEDYFEDLSSDCQDYVMSLPKYKDLDYDMKKIIINISMFLFAQAVFISFIMYALHLWSIQGGAI